MFRRVRNKQPGMQKFLNLYCYYQDIYDRISQLNKPSGSWFILYTGVYGGNRGWYFWALAYFHFLKALNNAFEVQFSGYSFLHPIIDTDNMQGHAAQIFFLKWKHC